MYCYIKEILNIFLNIKSTYLNPLKHNSVLTVDFKISFKFEVSTEVSQSYYYFVYNLYLI